MKRFTSTLYHLEFTVLTIFSHDTFMCFTIVLALISQKKSEMSLEKYLFGKELFECLCKLPDRDDILSAHLLLI